MAPVAQALITNMAVRTWLAGGLALMIVAGTFAVDTVFVPMHADARAQGLLGHVNALAFMLASPGNMVARVVAGGFDNRFALEYHLIAGLANVVFSFFVLYIALGLAAFAGGCGDAMARAAPSPDLPADPMDPADPWDVVHAAPVASPCAAAGEARVSLAGLSRRGFLLMSARAGAGVALAGATGSAAWALFVQPRRYEIVRHRLALPDLAAELDGLRVVHLSDIHHGPWLSLDYLARVVADTNALSPDLVLLTGDYVQGCHYIASCVAALAALTPRIGVLAVLGNHDWWEGVEEVRQAFAREGIPLIDNDRRVLTPCRRIVRVEEAGGGEARGLAIAGIGDYLEGAPDFAAALAGLPARMPCLLMSHWPDAAEDSLLRHGRWRVDLMLAGHTHGGQVRLPCVGTPVVPSRYGQKYAAGFVDGPACRVYVNRGIGTALLPIRWGVPPEITVFDLRCL